ncbi:hypothetical protein NZK35_31025 [Stieleria sp. ICT_E10.1]|uniref:hypothetical protein n=1 Tax=Stieleria sedimenti TaxID=2976331 RepID=UPI00217FDB90|nr:hypothetical protein [Stieleria sedimenti]MCS7471112.1 hypothetical protein [Stieleria sedimenti]
MFDPLHKWLGIPPSEQPPNDYRLLGLANFEDDPEVIDMAADRDLTFLHGLTNGEHGEAAEELSNRISAARVRLLNPEKKADYDAQLRELLDEGEIDIDSVIDSLGTAKQTPPETSAPVAAPQNASAILGIAASTPAAAPAPTTSPTTAAVAQTPRPEATPTPQVHSRPSGKTSRRKRLSLFWAIGVLPALLVLGYLVFSIWNGELHLDPNKLQRLGLPAEQAAKFAGDSKLPPHAETLPDAADATAPSDTPKKVATSLPPHQAGSGQTGPGRAGSNQAMAAVSPAPASPAPNPSPNRTPPSDASTTPASPPGSFSPAITPPVSPSLAEYVTPAGKHPIPSADSITAKMQTVRDLFQPEYLQAKQREQRIAVADQMRETADETKNDPEGRFALYRVAREIYIGESDFDSAFEMVDLLDQSFEAIDVMGLKRDVLESVAGRGVPTTEFSDAAINVADECLHAGRLDDGIAICKTLLETVQRIPSPQLGRLKDVEQQLADAKTLFGGYQLGLATLESNPDDADAQSAVGKYLCLVKNRWADGLPRLAAGSDPLYREAAAKELTLANADMTELQVADGWFKILDSSESSFEKRSLANHAKSFYQSARLKTAGLEVRKIDQRLIVLNALGTPGPLSAARIRAEQREAAAKAKLDAKNRALAAQPKVIQSRTYDSTASTDFARIRGNTIVVGMGNTSLGTGEAAAGIEFENVGTISVQGAPSHATMVTSSATSKIGFVIDYHTGSSYSKRVFLNFGTNTPNDFSPNPPWGTGKAPDDRDFLPVSPQYTLDLEKWAPGNWDGKCWFSVYMQNSGMNRMLTATVAWQPRSNPLESE